MKMFSKMLSKIMNKAVKMTGLSKSALKMLLLAFILLVIAYSMRNYMKKSQEGMDDKIDTNELVELLKMTDEETDMKENIEEDDSGDDGDNGNDGNDGDDDEEEVNEDDLLGVGNDDVETFANYSLIENMVPLESRKSRNKSK